MARFTKAVRQQIVRDFCLRHDGEWNPAAFVEEVRAKGPDHPAHAWFEWDADAAALKYQIEQAREFASDLRVKFSVENVGRNRPMTIRETEMPMVLSPLDGRSKGGGYFMVDPDNPDHMAEHCRQAASALASWLHRYRSAVEYVGGSVAQIERQMKALEGAAARETDKAA